MEDEQSFSDICGGRLALQRRCYSPSCLEFCLSCPRITLRSLTAVTCTVWLVAYGLFTLCENSMILSAAIFITLLGLLGYLHFVKIDHETLLIIDSLGIQMTSSYASGKESTTFIEMGEVNDVVINEAIYMQKVIYYLCILLKDPVEPHGISQVVPLFQDFGASGFTRQQGTRRGRILTVFHPGLALAVSNSLSRCCRF
ncbi:phosphatidylinositol N-acetylglucosaminyltransferase subunit H isoform X2 [Kogia breviceps]|uniref:phosphatidylinositol N-acetylglucosaminyltransferase subunit H isoform X2 n=1 Tax=Kogia breviceps TaxID=27615 RepID=UPI0034D1C10C